MRIKHSDKVKMARRLMTQAEISSHTPLFDTAAWRSRWLSRAAKRVKQYHKIKKQKGTFAESLEV